MNAAASRWRRWLFFKYVPVHAPVFEPRRWRVDTVWNDTTVVGCCQYSEMNAAYYSCNISL